MVLQFCPKLKSLSSLFLFHKDHNISSRNVPRHGWSLLSIGEIFHFVQDVFAKASGSDVSVSFLAKKSYGCIYMYMVRTTILNPLKLKKEAEKKAASQGMSLGELIRISLNQVLKGEPFKSGDDPFFQDREVYTTG